MAVDMAEKDTRDWSSGRPTRCSRAGADLQSMLPAFMMGGAKAMDGAEPSCSA
jgi:3-hydroxyacyl-CoA dehydrogenase